MATKFLALSFLSIVASDTARLKEILELAGKSFKTPVILSGTESLSTNNNFPIAFDVPKYFFADSSVMITELGAVNALLRSPYSKGKLNTVRKPGLADI